LRLCKNSARPGKPAVGRTLEDKMLKNRILLSLVIVLWGLILPTRLTAQRNPTNAVSKLPPAAPLLSPSICGKGVFSLWLGEQAIGREDFETKCQPDGGYAVIGHTDLKGPGASIDLNTTLEVDKSGEPLSSTAKAQ